jgi:hypothetical protein
MMHWQEWAFGRCGLRLSQPIRPRGRHGVLAGSVTLPHSESEVNLKDDHHDALRVAVAQVTAHAAAVGVAEGARFAAREQAHAREHVGAYTLWCSARGAGVTGGTGTGHEQARWPTMLVVAADPTRSWLPDAAQLELAGHLPMDHDNLPAEPPATALGHPEESGTPELASASASEGAASIMPVGDSGDASGAPVPVTFLLRVSRDEGSRAHVVSSMAAQVRLSSSVRGRVSVHGVRE